MKKLFLIIGIFTCIIGYGQTPVDQDSIDATQAPTNAMYGLVFDNAAKKIYHMTMEYYLPWTFSSPLLYPRSIANNVLIGATVNSYSDKLYVNGTATITGNLYGMNRIYVGADRSSYFSTIGSELYFYSPSTGSKSLGQISSGGGIDLTQVPNYAVISESADTAYGASNFTHKTGTVKILPAISDTGLYVLVPSGGDAYNKGLLIRNESPSGYGIDINNTTTGVGLNILNVTSGHAISGDQWPGATGSWAYISRPTGASGEAIEINSATGATGNVITIKKNGVTQVSIADSLFLNYIKPVTSGTRFVVLTGPNGGADSGVLNPVSVGLTDPLWDIHKHLADRQGKEISWYHIDDKTGKLIKSYKLANNMNAFEQLQYTAEMSLRLIAEQDKRIALLERKEYRMNRQDYKYKAKLLKLENRLK
jgi:hypothetical protein